MAINGKINLEYFVEYLTSKMRIFKNEAELEEIKNLFEFIFNQFDKGKPFSVYSQLVNICNKFVCLRFKWRT